MIPSRLAAEIRRLSRVEGWREGTIAREIGVHHSTVARALGESVSLDGSEKGPHRRASEIDSFIPWIQETFERYPSLPASVLYTMVRKRGYQGGEDHFRHRIADLGLRPRKAPEAFLVLRTLPGEQAQVDWAHFGQRKVLGGLRTLFAFVMVLSYSRQIFIRFFYDARLPNFLAGHIEAFEKFGGVARHLLYDNLKSAVLERIEDAIRFHPRLLELADHYGYEPRPVAPRRGNEKGRVERAIRYLRTSFFPLRETLPLDQLNAEADRWCSEVSSRRPWHQDRSRSVNQAFLEERSLLLPLPNDPFPRHEVVAVSVRRTPYVPFDANRYSVPHDRIARTLEIRADLTTVRILDGSDEIANHSRCWDKGQMIENDEHLEALWKSKRKARHHRNQDRLLRTVPQAQALLVELGRRQRNLRTSVDRLLRYLDEHGQAELAIAINEALESGSPHPETVRLVLERRRSARQDEPAITVTLPDDPRVRDLVVTPHPLADYDPKKDPGEDS